MPGCNHVISHGLYCLEDPFSVHFWAIVSKMNDPGDALGKLLIEKGLITRAEFMENLLRESASYRRDEGYVILFGPIIFKLRN